jgi:hypothetical protein
MSEPYRAPEVIFTFYDQNMTAKPVALVANHWAWRCLCKKTGEPSLLKWMRSYLLDLEDMDKTYDLVWCLSASYRSKNEISEQQFFEMMPSRSEGWDQLRAAVAGLIRESFLFPSVMPMVIAIHEIWKNSRNPIPTGEPTSSSAQLSE